MQYHQFFTCLLYMALRHGCKFSWLKSVMQRHFSQPQAHACHGGQFASLNSLVHVAWSSTFQCRRCLVRRVLIVIEGTALGNRFRMQTHNSHDSCTGGTLPMLQPDIAWPSILRTCRIAMWRSSCIRSGPTNWGSRRRRCDFNLGMFVRCWNGIQHWVHQI